MFKSTMNKGQLRLLKLLRYNNNLIIFSFLPNQFERLTTTAQVLFADVNHQRVKSICFRCIAFLSIMIFISLQIEQDWAQAQSLAQDIEECYYDSIDETTFIDIFYSCRFYGGPQELIKIVHHLENSGGNSRFDYSITHRSGAKPVFIASIVPESDIKVEYDFYLLREEGYYIISPRSSYSRLSLLTSIHLDCDFPVPWMCDIDSGRYYQLNSQGVEQLFLDLSFLLPLNIIIFLTFTTIILIKHRRTKREISDCTIELFSRVSKRLDGVVNRSSPKMILIIFCLIPIIFFIGNKYFNLESIKTIWMIYIFICLLWAIFFYKLIHPSKESLTPGLCIFLFTPILSVLLLGLFASLPPIISSLLTISFDQNSHVSLNEILVLFVVVGLPEEILKAILPFIFLRFLFKKHRLIKQIGLFLGIMSGIGFAIAEGALLSNISGGNSFLLHTLFRFMSGPILHASLTGISGWLMGNAITKNSRNRQIVAIVVAIAFAALLHSLYNATAESFWGLLTSLLIILIFLDLAQSQPDEPNSTSHVSSDSGQEYATVYEQPNKQTSADSKSGIFNQPSSDMEVPKT